MLTAVRSRALGGCRPVLPRLLSSASASPARPAELIELSEVEKVLSDVRAGDVRVFPVGEGGLHGGACADYMVVATGRSDWHVRNIAQAILYKIKQKQKGSDRILMPSVEGQQAGKWVVIDSGSIIIHALEERAREYYDLESVWTKAVSPNISAQHMKSLNSLIKQADRTADNSKKLKKPKPWKHTQAITPAELKQMREEFWDTTPHYDGQKKIWDALRAAADAELSLAQTIVDSAGIIVTNSDMTLCYDERGAKYELPKYVLSEPSNLIKEE